MQAFQDFISNTPIFALLIICVTYAIGDFVGTRTKAWIPSVFVVAILFLLGYWTIFPKDIVTDAGLGAPLGGIIAILLCITHMGTAISTRELLAQWKIIVGCIAGLIGMIGCCLLIGKLGLVDFNYIIAGLPSLTGGIVSATMMQTAATNLGLTNAALIAICMYVCQGFAGYPITAIMLKKEGHKILAKHRAGELQPTAKKTKIDTANGKAETTEVKKKLIPQIPDKYYSTATSLATMCIIGTLSVLINDWTKTFMGVYAINAAVVALILGIAATEFGFLKPNILKENGCFNFLMFALMIYIFSGLNGATPQILATILGPMVLIIIVGVIGMVVLSVIASKFLKISPYMAVATSLTALYGFPPNYVLTEEASNALTDDPEERQVLMDNMLPQMLVGGFVTVTITSVIIASIFIPMLHA